MSRAVDALTQLGLFFVRQVFYAGIGVDAGCFQDFLCAGSADPVDIGETDFDSLVFRQVNAGYTCHNTLLPFDFVLNTELFCRFRSLFLPEGSCKSVFANWY